MVEALTIFGISYWGDKPITMLGNMGLYGIILPNITQMVIVMGFITSIWFYHLTSNFHFFCNHIHLGVLKRRSQGVYCTGSTILP